MNGDVVFRAEVWYSGLPSVDSLTSVRCCHHYNNKVFESGGLNAGQMPDRQGIANPIELQLTVTGFAGVFLILGYLMLCKCLVE